MSPEQFEHFATDALRALGFVDTETTSYTRDNGVDANLLAAGLVQPGDELAVRGTPGTARLLDERSVRTGDATLSINAWAERVTGWESVSIYRSVVHVPSGATLGALRRTLLKGRQTAANGPTRAP